jgi:hypothetical protein
MDLVEETRGRLHLAGDDEPDGPVGEQFFTQLPRTLHVESELLRLEEVDPLDLRLRVRRPKRRRLFRSGRSPGEETLRTGLGQSKFTRDSRRY